MEYKYKAFISYRHVERDMAAAKALHTAIESYIIPDKLRTDGQKRLGKVFRDEEELGVTHDLPQTICEALDETEYLIVICSPDSAQSRWVRREITHFLSNHPAEKLLTVVTGGKPDEILSVIVPECPEPLYIDLSAGDIREMQRTLKDRFLKLCAALLDCNYDDLVMRDQKRKRRQMMWWITGIAAVASVIICILSWSYWQIDGKNEELAQKNEELEQRNDEILLHVSERLTLEAQQALEESDKPSAVRNALAALPSAELDRPYYAPAEQLLWDVLDPLHVNKDTMIPRNTVLEQESPVEEFCISGDGRLLTTIDPYSVLTCFDTVTGEQIWTNKLIADMVHSNIAIYPCPVWNSIIVIYGDTAYGVSQETGEVLWTNGNSYYDNYFEMSDDGRYLVCMVRTYSPSALSIAAISTQNGTTMNVYPVAESDYSFYLFDTDTYDFSADGTRFAGCYREQLSDESYEHVYFVTDLSNSSTEIIYRQKTTDPYEDIYKLSFTDGDTTLTVVRESGDSTIAAIVEKVSIPDKSLIWQTGTPDESDIWFLAPYLNNCLLVECDTSLLLGDSRVLYALDRTTGEIISSRTLDADLLTLEAGAGGAFTLVLADGTYNCGWHASSRLPLMNDFSSVFSSVPTDLGTIQRANLWNGGYLYARFDNGISLYYGPESEGFGYAAVIPQDNDCSVIIKRIMPFIADLDTRTALTTDSSEEIVLGSVSICSSDTISVQCRSETAEDGERHRFFLLDRAALEVTDSFAVDFGLNSYRNTFVLPDGSGLLYTDENHRQCLYDRASQTSTVLAALYDRVLFRSDGREVETYAWEITQIRSPTDHSVWTIGCTDRGMKVWINGQAQPDIPWPDTWKQLKSDSMYDVDVQMGGGSYLLADLPASSEAADHNRYDFYSIPEKKWYQIPFGENELSQHIACIGETSPIFTVMDSSGVIRTYDIPTGKLTMEIATWLSPNSVSQLKWILNDRYLTVFTVDRRLFILDGITGETVYQHSLSAYSYWSPPSFAADSKEERLYIWEDGGLCVDTRSWSTLFEIPDIEMYDPVSDRILYVESEYSDAASTDHLITYHVPTTEELVAIAKAYLGE